MLQALCVCDTAGKTGHCHTGPCRPVPHWVLTKWCEVLIQPSLCIVSISDFVFSSDSHTEELTIATLDPLASGWNNELPSKISTRIWHTVTDRAAVPERAVCHQWTALPSSWSVLSGTNKLFSFLKIPWLCSIPHPLPSNTNPAPVAEARLSEATALEGLRPRWGQAEPTRVLWCEKIPPNSPYHHFVWKCVREEAGNQQWNTAAPLLRGKKLF